MNNRFAASCQVPRIVIIDKRKPKNKLPQSPMNILAGLKLNIKNPRVDPNRIDENEPTKARLFWTAYKNIQIEEIKEIPQESPSILSRILNAFVIPTTQKTVKGMAIKGKGMILIFIPKKITIMVKRIWKINFEYAFILRRSSYSPKPNIAVTQRKMPIVNLLRGIKIKAGIIKERNMPTPPKSAVGFLCHRSSVGTAKYPYRCENLIMMGTIIIEMKKDVRKRIKYFVMMYF